MPYKPQNDELEALIDASLVDIVKQLEHEDESLRAEQVRKWRLHEEFWHNFQHVFWSEQNQSWQVPNAGSVDWTDESEGQRELEDFYDFVINIFKPHGESIIAAMGSQVPKVRFIPDDAENSDDLYTSEAYQTMSELIQRHNKAQLLIFRALMYLYLQGFCAAYNYPKSDSDFGTVPIPVFTESEIKSPDSFVCQSCGVSFEKDPTQCSNCGAGSSNIDVIPGQVEKLALQTGTKEVNKSREIIEIYGGLYVKVPARVRSQKECGYLILAQEQHFAFLRELYPKFRDKISAGSGDDDQGEKADRAPVLPTREGGMSEESSSYLTIKRCWLRPWVFNILSGKNYGDKDISDILREQFPQGCYVTLIGDLVVDKKGENLDVRWTICPAGISDKIHADALCTPMVSIQELRNTVVNLTAETIEHGIPDRYADTEVINYANFSQHRAAPGYTYPVKPRNLTMPLGNSFHETGRATLSREINDFKGDIDKDAQFVVSSFPSIYGGPSEGGSRTLGEYDSSRRQAMQRLSLVYSFVKEWWGDVMLKSCKSFAGNMIEDERLVKSEGTSFINTWVKMSALKGKVGGVEPESSEAFPVSLTEKRAAIMDVAGLGLEDINAAIFSPVNLGLLQRVLSLQDLKFPGEAQRQKQILEIQELSQTEPLDEETSSVPVEQDIDDHTIHMEVLENHMVSLQGIRLKKENPASYMNELLHYKAHKAASDQIEMEEKMRAQMMPQENQNAP